MKLTHSFRIPYDASLHAELRSRQEEAARVWNAIVAIAQEHWKTTRTWLSKSEIQSSLKKRYNLHSQTVQAIADKFCENRDSARTNRQNGGNARYPWREKRFFCLPFKAAGFEARDDVIVLKFIDQTDGVHQGKSISVSIPDFSQEDLASCTYMEVVWRNGYELHYTVEVAEVAAKAGAQPKKWAGVDLGEIHSVAAGTEENALLVSGRAIRAAKQFRAKTLAAIGRKLARCQKGSRRWKRLVRAKGFVKRKTEAQIRDWLHKTTRITVDFLDERDVTDLVIGNVDGIEKGTRKKRRAGRTRRQQLSTWEHGRLTDYLTYKARLCGIRVHKTEERNTSKTCSRCGALNAPDGRNYQCSACGRKIHRDVNSIANIVRKKHEAFRPVDDPEIRFLQPVWLRKYRRRDGVDGADRTLVA